MRLAVITCVALAMSCSSFGTTLDVSQSDGGPIAPADAAASATAYVAEVLADKPLAYWRLDDKTLQPTTKSEIPGTDAAVVGSPSVGVAGALPNGASTAYAFNGDGDDGIDAGKRFDFPGAAPFTLEAWVKLDEVDGDFRHLFTKDDYPKGLREEYGIYVNTGVGLAFERHSAGIKVEVRSKNVRLRVWHHIVGTYDGAELALYVDGALGEKKPDAGSQAAKDVALHIGRKAPNLGPLKGAMDEIAIYGTALSEARIKRHFDAAMGN